MKPQHTKLKGTYLTDVNIKKRPNSSVREDYIGDKIVTKK